MNRRKFLKSLAGTAAIKAVAPLAPLAMMPPIRWEIDPAEVARLIPIYRRELQFIQLKARATGITYYGANHAQRTLFLPWRPPTEKRRAP